MWRSAALASLVVWTLACGGSQRASGTGAPVIVQVEAVDGGELNTRRYRGKIVVIHLFTTWSLAAQSDIPQLIEAHDGFGDAIAIIGIALDPDGYRLVAPWRKANRIEYLVGLGSDVVMSGQSQLGAITEVPTTVILDRAGRVVHRRPGPLADGELSALVTGLLAGK